MNVIYLDNNATTRTADEAVDAMEAYYRDFYGNPHSAHRLGRRAHEAIEAARREIAEGIGAGLEEIVFTSCGTESNAIAIMTAVAQKKQPRIVVTAVEHPSVLSLVESLVATGRADVDVVSVLPGGAIDLEALDRSLHQPADLLCLMLAQNETGVIHDVAAAARIARAAGTRLLVDAVQAFGKIDVDVEALGADYLSLSGHKFHAPKGVGVLYARRGTPVEPLWHGGGQEAGRRSGTEPVPSIVGLGVAARLAVKSLERAAEVASLRNRLEEGVLETFPSATINGAAQPRLPNTSSISFPSLRADQIVDALDAVGVCVSAGAACHSGAPSASRTMRAMGVDDASAIGTVRFSLSRDTTAAEIDEAIVRIGEVVGSMRRGGEVAAGV